MEYTLTKVGGSHRHRVYTSRAIDITVCWLHCVEVPHMPPTPEAIPHFSYWKMKSWLDITMTIA